MAGVVAVALGISALGLYGITRYYRTAKISDDRSRIPGKLLKCELIQRIQENADVFNLDVKYSYHIDGEVFESTKIMFYFPEWSTCRSDYVKLQDTLAKTSDLTVYVNPHNPRESVLFPGADHCPVWRLAMACIMMLVCPISGAVAVYMLLVP
jgi:hypothetical protein